MLYSVKEKMHSKNEIISILWMHGQDRTVQEETYRTISQPCQIIYIEAARC